MNARAANIGVERAFRALSVELRKCAARDQAEACSLVAAVARGCADNYPRSVRVAIEGLAELDNDFARACLAVAESMCRRADQ